MSGSAVMSSSEHIQLTPGQQFVFDGLSRFIDDPHARVFILKGYAGTGKTTLMRFLVRHLKEIDRPYRLLASTGRAAKILSNLTDDSAPASTIHSMIYHFGGLSQDLTNVTPDNREISGQLFLIFQPTTVDSSRAADENMVYIIDEASMISDLPSNNSSQALFGSGRLLHELLAYDTRPTSKFLFVGDPCQLPPIESTFSPALLPQYYRDTFGLEASEAQLTQILRQQGAGDIVSISHQIRKRFALAPDSRNAYRGMAYRDYLPFTGSANISLHASLGQLIDHYIQSIRQHGYNHAICISRSNKSCYYLSLGIRKLLGIEGGVVAPGDLLMVVQNNPCGLLNGDMVQVVSVSSSSVVRAGLHFREVELCELFTRDHRKLLLLEETLITPQVNLSSAQQKDLFIDFAIRMQALGIRQGDVAFNESMRTDPYLNALRCNYGYAITCHKAQGGEWNEVYIDLPDNFMWQPTKSTYQWIYTAITRASRHLHLVRGRNIQYQ